MVSLALLIVLALIASIWWYSQRRVPTTVRAGGAKVTELPPDLERWFAAGLVSEEQVHAIVEFEDTHRPARRIPLLTEALGYIGAVLALAGGGVAIGQRWEDLSDGAHVAILAAATAVALLAGSLIRRQTEPAIQRMTSVLWTLSVAGFGGTLGVFFVDAMALSEDARALVIGGSTALYAGTLWAFHRQVLQEFALFAPGLVAAIGIAVILPGDADAWIFALITWVYGAVWMLLGWRGWMQPQWGALALGSVVIAFAGSVGAGEHGWLLGVGLATGAALMTLSITAHRLPLLGVGGIASFAYLTALVVRYFGDTLGIPTALAIVGGIVLVLAVMFGRSGMLDGSGWRHPHPVG